MRAQMVDEGFLFIAPRFKVGGGTVPLLPGEVYMVTAAAAPVDGLTLVEMVIQRVPVDEAQSMGEPFRWTCHPETILPGSIV